MLLRFQRILKSVALKNALITTFPFRSFSGNFNNRVFLLAQSKYAIPKRTNSSLNKLFKSLDEDECKIIDQVPQHYELIYFSGLRKYLLGGQITAVLIFIGTAILVLTESINYGVNPRMWIKNPSNLEEEVFVYTLFSSLLIVGMALNVMIFRTPIRIYNFPAKQQYKFVFYGNLPFKQRTVSCNLKDISKIEESGIMPWKNCRCELKNQQVVIYHENGFRNFADLNIMLGYQKQQF